MSATLTFSDNFNSLSLYSSVTGKGTWDTTYWWADGIKSNGATLTGNQEQEWYINADYAPTAQVKPWTVDNGILNIRAAPASPQISSLINGYSYTSGMLDTYHSFSQTYGYFEMSADLPAGKGLWPAFWLLPADGSWPPELDVMEMLGDDPTRLYTAVHSNTLTGGQESLNGGAKVADMSAGYHTYAVDWERDHITWYFDNKQVYQVATPSDMNKPMYMLVNLAVGGVWPGSPDGSTSFPADMKVDYVKAWSSNPHVDENSGSAPVPPGETTPPAPGGQVLTATQVGSVLTGGAGDDTLIASQANDTLTGGAGHDRFVFRSEPWSPIHIADFQVGQDSLDLSALLKADGYTGADPVADGWIYLVSDGAGGTNVRFDHDGHGSSPVWPNTIIKLHGIAPGSVTWAQLSGDAANTAPPTAGPPAGEGPPGLTLSTDQPYVTLTGGAGVDTLSAGPGYDTLTGGAGADHFVLTTEPWAPVKITDFEPGVDKLDLSALLKTAGYTGSNPLADGYLFVQSDGAGGSIIRFDHDGHGDHPVWPNTIIDLVGLAPSLVKMSDWIIH